MLSPYRVLDATDDRGELAGMILGDLGADVIRVEPPQGSPARKRGPLAPASWGREDSLQFFAFNRNKRSIAIDLATDRGRVELLALVRGADFVLESSPNGLFEENGLRFDDLCEVQPRIVHAQITPFGADGPYAAQASSDLTIAALGGPMSLQGAPDRAPVRVSVPQVWRHTGAEAAVAALMAHERMRQTGAAQFVDVSGQCAMTWTMLNGMSASAIQGHDFERLGSCLQLGPITLPIVFECADGHVVAIPNGELMEALLDWLIAEGLADESWRTEDWGSLEMRVIMGGELDHSPEENVAVLSKLFRGYTKTELFDRALRLGATVAPVNTIGDLVRFPHLLAREFWQEAEGSDGRRIKVPGVFARSTCKPLRIQRPAPALDEHGSELRQELASRPRIPAKSSPGNAAGLPLAGLKVADFSWIGVGPISAKYLADHGATVVRVESMARPCKLRLVGPFREGIAINGSHFFSEMNTSKQSLSLDLKNPAAIEVAKQLIAWSDVYLESFTPGAVDRIGIGYEVARELNPSIIMLSTCLMGQTGPAAAMAGYGYHAGAVAGFYEVTGWPDHPPAGPWMAYTDTIAPRFVAATLLAAIDHRQRTGEGQHIDGAQLEMGLQFLAPEILDYQLNGFEASRCGNASTQHAPHLALPCAGEDQWCAVAVESDVQWKSLRRVLGDPEWARSAELDTAAGRVARQEELEEALAAWSRGRDAHKVMEELLGAGVPAGVVQRSSDLLRDPQYRHRAFHRELTHPEIGPSPHAGHQFRIRGYESGPLAPGPTLGQHNFDVLGGILGLDDEAIAQLYAEGAIE